MRYKFKNPLDSLNVKIKKFKKQVSKPQSQLIIDQRIDAETRLEANCTIETDITSGKSSPVDCDFKIIQDKLPPVQYAKDPRIKIKK